MKPVASDSRTAPSAWVLCWAPSIPKPGPVLDLACGAGRHANWLKEQGFNVAALDRDLDALNALAPGVEAISADLEDGSPWPLGARRFAGIVVTNYLHRPILGHLSGALGPGGLLIYETFSAGNERFGRPSNPDFLLRPGELLEFCRDAALVVLGYECLEVAMPRPAMVQRLAAKKAALG